MKKLDTRDKRLLAELDNNSRATLSELAKKLRLSREAVNYRIKRLKEEGYIRGFVTHIDYTKLGYDIYTLYFKFGTMKGKEEDEVITYLENNPDTNWSALVGGRFDFILEFPAKNVRDFKKKEEKIISKYPNVLVEHEVGINTHQQRLNRRYLYPIPSKIIEWNEEIVEVDKKDEKIIEILKKNARTTSTEIGKQVGLTTSTVSTRIKELKRKGVVLGFSIQLDTSKYDYHAFKTFIKMSTFSEKIDRMLKTFCETNPNVVYFVTSVGRWDYEIDFDAASHEEYRRILRQFKNLMGKTVTDIETLEIFRSYRFTY
jgi:DNA-binding Lrp family transcriptional regulator